MASSTPCDEVARKKKAQSRAPPGLAIRVRRRSTVMIDASPAPSPQMTSRDGPPTATPPTATAAMACEKTEGIARYARILSDGRSPGSGRRTRLVGARPRRHRDPQHSQRALAGYAELKVRSQRDRETHAWFQGSHLFTRPLAAPDLAAAAQHVPDLVDRPMGHG